MVSKIGARRASDHRTEKPRRGTRASGRPRKRGRAPLNGVVEQVLVTSGTYIEIGTPIATITDFSRDLATLVFLTAADAKLVQPGMAAQVSPGTAKKEEWGHRWRVRRSLRRYRRKPYHPPQERRTRRPLRPERAPIMVRVDLLKHADTGEFKWTSNTPPPFDITPGTLSTVTITVRRQSPITLVIPAFERCLD